VSNIGKSRIVIGDFPEQSLNRYNVSSVREKRTDARSQRLDDRNITDTWTSLMKPHQVKSEPQNRRISIFDILFFRVSFSIRLTIFRPAAALDPESSNPERSSTIKLILTVRVDNRKN
jgi:hypothetical protein